MAKIMPLSKRESLKKRNRMEMRHLTYFILPGLILTIIFKYLPMFGVVIAFKEFNPNLGILGSRWVGFDNFKFFFTSDDFVRIVRNTLGYSLANMIVGNFISVIIAVLCYNIHKRGLLKFYQTSLILPNFLSMVLVAYIVYIFLNPTYGLVNGFLKSIGIEGISWYSEPKYWPFILVFVSAWKGCGQGSIIYYAAMMGIDDSLLEAAKLDGAKHIHEVIYIIIPEIASVICIYLILGVGGMMNGDFGLFYQVPMNIGALYPTTDIINTYVFRALQGASTMGQTAAVGLFQSGIGFILTWAANKASKKVTDYGLW